MWRFFFLVFLFVTPVFGAPEYPTAYEALRVVGQELNRGYVNQVISITGVDGVPQPQTWKILLDDRRARGGIREIEVKKGRVVAERTPARTVVGSTEGATIDTRRLNLDSSGAFSVASYTAEKSHTPFARVSYTLRTDERSNPIWIVTLQSEDDRPVGTIHIGANKGRVTRVEGMFRGADMAQVQEDRLDRRAPAGEEEYVRSDDGDSDGEEQYTDGDDVYDEEPPADGEEVDESIFERRFKRMFRRTQNGARHLFEKGRRSFQDFFYRE